MFDEIVSPRIVGCGIPGSPIGPLNITAYDEVPTGNIFFSRPESISTIDFDVVSLGEDQGGDESLHKLLEFRPVAFGDPISSLAFMGRTPKRVSGCSFTDTWRPLIRADELDVPTADTVTRRARGGQQSDERN